MQIRQATERDIPAIVNLLKLSLGESLIPKSEAYWRWKHIQNPFGPSPVLIAEENDQIIGVRAFMRWQWTDGERTFGSFRAVDTATHPHYYGKGIFKKLTTRLVEQCKKEGGAFIFNTPNSQSRPGYLKMGWLDAGRLPVQVLPINTFGMIRALMTKKIKAGIAAPSLNPLHDLPLEAILDADKKFRKDISTVHSVQYLKWRYVDVPVARYSVFTFKKGESSTVIIGRLKPFRLGTEFRITDFFSTEAVIGGSCKKAFLAFARSNGAHFVTCSGTLSSRFPVGVTLGQGPITTFRELNIDGRIRFAGFIEWRPGLGDLELF